MLYVLDYGAGNVRSLANALTRLAVPFAWIASPADFDRASQLVFPGVGSFRTAAAHLRDKGLLAPLHDYLRSGRPYFGICIGLQLLCAGSDEAPAVPGLALVPAPVARLDSAHKAVPHIGWNTVQPAGPARQQLPPGLDPAASYYFVHSFCLPLPGAGPAADWVCTTTEYGRETFVSTVRRHNVFATQFHPEKSGPAGLTLLHAWVVATSPATTAPPPNPSLLAPRPEHRPPVSPGLTKRIVACLDVRSNDAGDLVVTKGDQYDVRESASSAATVAGRVRNLGKPVDLAARYFAQGADELCLLNITSFRQSPLEDQPMLAVVQAAAEQVFVPLTIGGGIKDTVDPDGTPHSALQVASLYFRAGADKVSIGSDAVSIVEKLLRGENVENNAITSIATAYGSQAVVVSIDPKRHYVDSATYDGPYKTELVLGTEHDNPGRAWWYQCTIYGGRETRPLSVTQLAKGVEKLGAGEILVNSIDRDGTGLGFDIALLQIIKSAVTLPIVASSGAGTAEHFVDLFSAVDVEAGLAAGIFHRNEVEIADVKRLLGQRAFRIRMA